MRCCLCKNQAIQTQDYQSKTKRVSGQGDLEQSFRSMVTLKWGQLVGKLKLGFAFVFSQM
jgi:hypothetical protein